LYPVETKSKGLAAFLSLIFPGLGQLYNGRIGRGLTFILVSIFSIFLMAGLIGFLIYPLVWLYGIVDAYNGAKMINVIAIQRANAAAQQVPPPPQYPPAYQMQQPYPMYPQQGSNAGMVREKETIVREIVKVPCPYCRKLVDITQDKCPNCGAQTYRG
jgi:TM2 domain-containing membrane protein YozV